MLLCQMNMSCGHTNRNHITIFRRIMCNLIGSWVEKGMYAYDEDILKEIVEGISYNNAIKYFNFE